MWLHTIRGFYSITRSTYTPGLMQIRARDDRSLELLINHHFIGSETDANGGIVDTPTADYRWRVLVSLGTLTKIMETEATGASDYSNFKNACHDNHPEVHPDQMATWSAGMRHQHERCDALGLRNQDAYGTMDQAVEAQGHEHDDAWDFVEPARNDREFADDPKPENTCLCGGRGCGLCDRPTLTSEQAAALHPRHQAAGDKACTYCEGDGCTICEQPPSREEMGDWHCDHCQSWNQTAQTTCGMCGNTEGGARQAAQEA